VKIANFEANNYLLIIAAASAAALALLCLLLFGPMVKTIHLKEAAWLSLASQVRDVRNVIAAAGKIDAERDFLDVTQTSLAIDELVRHGKGMKVAFHSIRPRDLTQDTGSSCKVLPIDVAIEASDRDMAAFIGSLDELKKDLITVTSFSAEPDRNDPTKLMVTMTVNLYFLAGEGRGGK